MTVLDIPADSLFGIENLPYGVFSTADSTPRVGVRVGDSVVDLAATLGDDVFAQPTLNAFMAQGRMTSVPDTMTVLDRPWYPTGRCFQLGISGSESGRNSRPRFVAWYSEA